MRAPVRFDGRQMTMPLFDKELLSLNEEMAEIVEYVPVSGGRHIEIMGGMHKGGVSGQEKRLFAAGRIHTEGRSRIAD